MYVTRTTNKEFQTQPRNTSIKEIYQIYYNKLHPRQRQQRVIKNFKYNLRSGKQELFRQLISQICNDNKKHIKRNFPKLLEKFVKFKLQSEDLTKEEMIQQINAEKNQFQTQFVNNLTNQT